MNDRWLKKRYNKLLKLANELEEFMDNPELPYEERMARLPEWERIQGKLNDILQHFPTATREEILEGFDLDSTKERKPKYIHPEAWEKEGWVLVYSDILKELIVVVKDKDIHPKGVSGLVKYKLEEVALLDGKSEEEIKRIHMAKKAFEGTITAKKGLKTNKGYKTTNAG